MTTEMGPRDVDLSWYERLSARAIKYISVVFGTFDSGSRVHFRPETATISITGESEQAGEPYQRGILVTLLFMINVFIWLLPVELLNALGQQAGSGPVLWASTAALIPLMLFIIVNALGTLTLLTKTDVVDHTTEPAPEELDDLQQQYVDGEIDESELGERAAEVWER